MPSIKWAMWVFDVRLRICRKWWGRYDYCRFQWGSPSSYKLVSLFVAEVWGVPTFSIVHSSGNGSSSQCSVSSFNSTSLIFGGCAIGGIHTVPTQTTGFAPIAFNYNSYFAMDRSNLTLTPGVSTFPMSLSQSSDWAATAIGFWPKC